MRDEPTENPANELPLCATEFIAQVIKKIRYRRKVRADVQAELTAHFEDELRGCVDVQERDRRAHRLIDEFGDAKLLAVLCRRAKKRCRPLWLRTFLHTLQAAGVFLLVFIPYTVWFVRGEAHPTIDYLPQLNALHEPAGGVADNAWPYYERAMRLVVEPNETIKQALWFKSLKPSEQPLTAQDRKILGDWAAVNSLAWLQLELGSARRHCHRVYHRAAAGLPLWDSTVDPLVMGKLRRLAQLGLWQARLAMEQGHVDEALDRCLTLLRVGAHWETNASLVDQLMGQSMSAGVAGRELLRIVAAAELSVSQLSDLQMRLLQPYEHGYPLMDFDGERLFVLDKIQYCFTDGGPGRGHFVASRYMAELKTSLDTSETEPSAIADALASPVGVGLSMIHASRNKTIAKIDRVHRRLGELARLSPYERRIAGIEDMSRAVGPVERWRYALVYALLPAEQNALQVAFRARAEYEALVAVVAAKRYRLETGGYPPDLQTLVDAGYLGALPMDPFSDRPLVYRPAGDSFLLYSVGRDFVDNGGEVGRDEGGKPKLWAEKGDAVFWPVTP